MNKNTFKHGLADSRPKIGLWLGLANAYSAEIVAGVGFDFLVIDGEHSPNDLRSILAQLQAIAPYTAHPVVRPPSGDAVLIKQLLDIGVQTLLIPMVETADQARALVAAMCYPPQGIRGVGSVLARASRWGKIKDYILQADEEMCLIVQVESVTALENLDQILAVEGVDGVFIGPADLAASMGYPADPSHPNVLAAIEKAIAAIAQSGKAAGILAMDEAKVQRYSALGARFIAVGIDTGLLAQAASNLVSRFSLLIR